MDSIEKILLAATVTLAISGCDVGNHAMERASQEEYDRMLSLYKQSEANLSSVKIELQSVRAELAFERQENIKLRQHLEEQETKYKNILRNIR